MRNRDFLAAAALVSTTCGALGFPVSERITGRDRRGFDVRGFVQVDIDRLAIPSVGARDGGRDDALLDPDVECRGRPAAAILCRFLFGHASRPPAREA